VKRRIHKNKKNNQLIITIPRKKLDFLEEKEDPKYIKLRLRRGDFEW